MHTISKINTTLLKVNLMREFSTLLKSWLVYAILVSIPLLAYAETIPANTLDGFSLGGYAATKANIHPDGNKEVDLQNLSLFLGWEGDSRWRLFSELELEKPLYWASDSKLTVNQAKLNLERLYVDYNLSENLNLRTGRFFSPVGRWNLIHADPLVWTTTRPLATTRLFPQSTNGVMLFGSKSIDTKIVDYSVYVEAVKNEDKERNLGDADNLKGIHVSLSGDQVLGLSLLEFNELTPIDKKYRMIGLDFQTKIKGWELTAEGFQRYFTNGSTSGSGGYIQVAAPITSNWYAVTRLDGIQMPNEDNTSRWLVGAAWKKTRGQIFKIEYVGGSGELSEAPKGLITSFSLLF